MECLIWILHFMIIDQGPWCMRINTANNILLSSCMHWNTCLDNGSLRTILSSFYNSMFKLRITNWILCWKWFLWQTLSKLCKLKAWTSYYPGHIFLHTSPRHIRVDKFRPRDDTVPHCYSYHTFSHTQHHTCSCRILKRFNIIQTEQILRTKYIKNWE